MSGQKCNACQKTAYPLESEQIGSDRWHKLCFKCAACGTKLNVKTCRQRDGGVYCDGCGSARFDKNAQTAETMETKLVKDRPKVGPVNEQLRGELVGQKTQVNTDSMMIKSAAAAPKVSTVNEQVRGGEDQQKNTQIHF